MPPVVPPLDHLIALSDDTGIIQHALEAVPNRATGYCTDDVARAFMVALARMRTVPRDDAAMRSIFATSGDSLLVDARDKLVRDYAALRPHKALAGSQEEQGRSLFAANCSLCHGANREGKPPAIPSLVSSRLSDEQIRSVVQHGRDAVAGAEAKAAGIADSARQTVASSIQRATSAIGNNMQNR